MVKVDSLSVILNKSSYQIYSHISTHSSTKGKNLHLPFSSLKNWNLITYFRCTHSQKTMVTWGSDGFHIEQSGCLGIPMWPSGYQNSSFVVHSLSLRRCNHSCFFFTVCTNRYSHCHCVCVCHHSSNYTLQVSQIM